MSLEERLRRIIELCNQKDDRIHGSVDKCSDHRRELLSEIECVVGQALEECSKDTPDGFDPKLAMERDGGKCICRRMPVEENRVTLKIGPSNKGVCLVEDRCGEWHLVQSSDLRNLPDPEQRLREAGMVIVPYAVISGRYVAINSHSGHVCTPSGATTWLNILEFKDTFTSYDAALQAALSYLDQHQKEGGE